MKMWNCFMMYHINDELDSTESYGIFSTLEAAIENILQEHKVDQQHKELDYDYYWHITENEARFHFPDGTIYGWDITLKNLANKEEKEELYFHIEKHEVDKG